MDRKAQENSDSALTPFIPRPDHSYEDIPRRGTHTRYLTFHLCLVILYSTAAFLYSIRHRNSAPSVTRPIHYTTFTESPFAGPKFPQTDSAWAGLLAGINIRVSSSDVESSHLNTSVALPKGGYLAWPEAMHQLHCVKRIREWVHRAEYHPDLDGDDEAHWLKHMDHCIELLRQSVMCVPDKALMGFHWEEDTSRPVLNMKGPEHQCGDWDAYVRSVRERSVDSVEMKELSRPVYL